MSASRLSCVVCRLAALPGERGSPRPSPSGPWQNWQSALSWNRRWPNEVSCAKAAHGSVVEMTIVMSRRVGKSAVKMHILSPNTQSSAFAHRSVDDGQERCINCAAAHEHADRALAHPTRRRASEPEHKQHRLVALLLQLRRERMLADRDAAQAREDRDILLAIDLEGHRRCIEANADIDLPELLQGRVVIGDERPIREA